MNELGGMMAKNILNDEHTYKLQSNWIKRQLDAAKSDSFHDLGVAKRYFDSNQTPLNEFKHDKLAWFTSTYLTPLGLKRLKGALRANKHADNNGAHKARPIVSFDTYNLLQSLTNDGELTHDFVIETALIHLKRTMKERGIDDITKLITFN